MDLVNHLEGRLLFAVPKKGRLQSAALDLLSGSDIQFRRSPRLDIALVKNLPIALIFLPAADIPTFVGEGRVDLGITGRDQVEEHDAKRAPTYPVQSKSKDGKEEGESGGRKGVNGSGVEELLDLGFGKCSLQIQVPEISNITDPRSLIGKNVVTSFTALTERYFRALEAEVEEEQESSSAQINDDTNNEDTKATSAETPTPKTEKKVQEAPRPLKTNIIHISGSVEASCALGVADGIIDLVESGETMRAAGLTPIATVLDSTAVLIKGKSTPPSSTPSSPSSTPSSSNQNQNQNLIQTLTRRIQGIITAQSYVLCQYNIPFALLPKARSITPGRRAPTVTNLAEEEGWVAVSSMVPKREIAGVMDRLTECGATDVLELGIMNSRV